MTKIFTVTKNKIICKKYTIGDMSWFPFYITYYKQSYAGKSFFYKISITYYMFSFLYYVLDYLKNFRIEII